VNGEATLDEDDEGEGAAEPSEPIVLLVPATLAGVRADKALVELLGARGHAVTRAELQRWLEAGHAVRDGAPLDRKTPLREGDRVTVTLGAGATTDAVPDPTVVYAVVHEDEHLIVVNKPAGLVVHPARGHRGGTLVHGLLSHGGFERANADPRDPEGHLRPGIVHRLDKDTSGLLVVAKDGLTREGLKALFARHDIEREYLALSVGRTRSARYDTAHGRHPQQRLRFTSRLDSRRDGVRRAITHVTALRPLADDRATLVRCTLETGRTHQIRVHLADEARTPILGDALYGGVPSAEPLRSVALALARQALHAAVLGFAHPITGERLRWESPPPADFCAALEALGGSLDDLARRPQAITGRSS
jgi:23S rRNA pseudouridine1911/1915/1917 synthase